jgi:hypothetical protein
VVNIGDVVILVGVHYIKMENKFDFAKIEKVLLVLLGGLFLFTALPHFFDNYNNLLNSYDLGNKSYIGEIIATNDQLDTIGLSNRIGNTFTIRDSFNHYLKNISIPLGVLEDTTIGINLTNVNNSNDPNTMIAYKNLDLETPGFQSQEIYTVVFDDEIILESNTTYALILTLENPSPTFGITVNQSTTDIYSGGFFFEFDNGYTKYENTDISFIVKTENIQTGTKTEIKNNIYVILAIFVSGLIILLAYFVIQDLKND